jgi:hypothetical protein
MVHRPLTTPPPSQVIRGGGGVNPPPARAFLSLARPRTQRLFLLAQR